MAAVQGKLSTLMSTRTDPTRIVRQLAVIVPVAMIVIMVLGPIVLMVMVSFWKKTGLTMVPAMTLQSYLKFFQGVRLDVFLRSLWVALSSTGLMLVIAYPIAWIIARSVRPSRVRGTLFLFSVPFLVNYIMRTFSWGDILARNGWINQALLSAGLVDGPVDWLLYSHFAVYLGLIAAYMPFMIFPIWLSLSNIDSELEHASWMLGEGPRTTFLRVILPLTLPGVFAAAIFGFVGAFGEVAVSSILGGTGYQLLGNTVVSAMNVIDYPLAAAISTVAVTLMLILLLIWFRLFDLRLFLGKIIR